MPLNLKKKINLGNFHFGGQRMNKSSLFCLINKIAGHRFKSVANPF